MATVYVVAAERMLSIDGQSEAGHQLERSFGYD